MDGYYDHHALVTLERPIAITGSVHPEVRHLGYRLAALYGLPYADLQRAMEHRRGASAASLRSELAPLAYSRLEQDSLRELVRARPRGVITLPDRAIAMRANRRELAAHCFVVALDYSADQAYRKYRDIYPESAPGWILEAPGPVALRSMYDQWNRRLRFAHLRVEMGDGGVQPALQQLVARLQSDERTQFVAH